MPRLADLFAFASPPASAQHTRLHVAWRVCAIAGLLLIAWQFGGYAQEAGDDEATVYSLEPLKPAQEARAAELIADLSAEDVQTVEAAQAALLALAREGDVEPLLQQATESPLVEVAWRARQLLIAMGRPILGNAYIPRTPDPTVEDPADGLPAADSLDWTMWLRAPAAIPLHENPVVGQWARWNLGRPDAVVPAGAIPTETWAIVARRAEDDLLVVEKRFSLLVPVVLVLYVDANTGVVRGAWGGPVMEDGPVSLVALTLQTEERRRPVVPDAPQWESLPTPLGELRTVRVPAEVFTPTLPQPGAPLDRQAWFCEEIPFDGLALMTVQSRVVREVSATGDDAVPTDVVYP